MELDMGNVRRLTFNPPLTEAEFEGFCAANPDLEIDRDPSGVIIVRRGREGRDDYGDWLLSQRGTIGSEIDLDDDERSSAGTEVHNIVHDTENLQALARMPQMKTIRTVFRQGVWLSAETLSHAGDWKSQGRIFSVILDGKEYFPRYEFNALFQPLPVIRDILNAFGAVDDPWKIAVWMHFPNGWITEPRPEGPKPVAPKDALDRPEDILKALKKRRGSYAA